VLLHHVLNLFLYRVAIEGSGLLHRRIVDRRQCQLLNLLLDENKALELTGEDVVDAAGTAGVERLAANRRRAPAPITRRFLGTATAERVALSLA
jgi:hypothetical protein